MEHEESYEQQAIKNKEIEDRLNKAYFSAFHSPEGQIVLKDLMDSFYRNTSLSHDADPNKILINEGKRFVVIHILNRMEQISGKPED